MSHTDSKDSNGCQDPMPVTIVQRFIQFAAFTFVAMSAFGFLYVAIVLTRRERPAAAAGPTFWQELLSVNFDIFAIMSVSIMCVIFALRLFSKAGGNHVIIPEDRAFLRPLIETAQHDSIGEYIRLASLWGFTGTFTKLGFTGLALATVALTLLLFAGAIFVEDDELKKGLFDMGKLTLGAFLGSFVQKFRINRINRINLGF